MPLNCCKSVFLRYIVMATTHLGSRHCITLAILVDRCNYSEFYFDVVNTKSTKLNRTLLKSIKNFKPFWRICYPPGMSVRVSDPREQKGLQTPASTPSDFEIRWDETYNCAIVIQTERKRRGISKPSLTVLCSLSSLTPLCGLEPWLHSL